jgi:hypothetical protein
VGWRSDLVEEALFHIGGFAWSPVAPRIFCGALSKMHSHAPEGLLF